MRKALPGEVLTVIIDALIHHYDWVTKRTKCEVKLTGEQRSKLKYRKVTWLGYAPDRCRSCFE